MYCEGETPEISGTIILNPDDKYFQNKYECNWKVVACLPKDVFLNAIPTVSQKSMLDYVIAMCSIFTVCKNWFVVAVLIILEQNISYVIMEIELIYAFIQNPVTYIYSMAIRYMTLYC
jgi:hypothetical protein